ncbi:hypothetical protein BD779DRAFT_1739474, partial [Infundibulicybe gibba]
ESHLSGDSRFVRKPVQTFFAPVGRKYFSVVLDEPHSPGSTPDLYRIYLHQEAGKYQQSTNINPPTHAKEVPPLLRITNWHEHLANYTQDKKTLWDLRSLMKFSKLKPGFDRLGQAVFEYAKVIRKKALDAPVAVRRSLMECPRTRHSEPWRPHTDDTTLKDYSTLLRHFVHAILMTLEDSPTTYCFPLTPQDRVRGLELLNLLKSPTEDLIRPLHEFISPFLLATDVQDSACRGENKWDSVLECCLALYCLTDDGNFKRPQDVTPVLAKLEYHCRGAMLYEASTNLEKFHGDPNKAINHYAVKNIQPGAISPFNTIVEYQQFASTLAYASNSPPITRVSPDGKLVTYSDKTLSVPLWVNALSRLADQIEQKIRDLFNQEDLEFSIPDKTPDDWNNETRGYSWMENKTFTRTPLPLLESLINQGRVLFYLDQKGKLIPIMAAMTAVMEQAAIINKLLALLIFTTCGQTPRVAEFVDHKPANSTRPRTIFRDEQGYFWFVTRRVKFESLIKRDVFIPIKANPRVNKILEKYLVLIRPLEQTFACTMWGPKQAQLYHEYFCMDMGDRLHEEAFGMALRDFTESFGPIIGPRDYRQLMVQVARTYLGSEHEVNEYEEDVLAAQRGHGIATSRRSYAPEVGHLPCMSSDLLLRYGHISEAWWQVVGFKPYFPPSLPLNLRNKFIQPQQLLANPHPQPASNPSPPDAGLLCATLMAEIHKSEARTKDNMEHALAASLAEALRRNSETMAALITSSIGGIEARMMQNIGEMFSKRSEPSPQNSREQLDLTNHQVSPWHPSLPQLAMDIEPSGPSHEVIPPENTPHSPAFQPDDVMDIDPDGPSEVISPENTSHPPIAQPDATMDIDLDKSVVNPLEDTSHPPTSHLASRTPSPYTPLLQQLFPKIHQPTFKSIQQQQLVELALQRNDNFLGILPTGGGKSLVYLLPSLHETDMITIVISPNKALLTDQLSKAQEMGVECHHWIVKMGATTIHSGIVFMAMETIISTGFNEFWVENHERVARIVLDECHQVLTSRNHRSDFGKLGCLAKREVQKIFLTASLPLRLEREFLDSMNLPESTLVVRTPAHQPQLRYHVTKLNANSTDIDQFTASLVEYVTKQHLGDRRGGIVFCETKIQANLIGNLIGCPVSHAGTPPGARNANEASWLAGTSKWIAATTGLIHGVDHPDCGAVIMLNQHYGLLNIYQGAGRGGRNGQPAWVFVINNFNYMKSGSGL